MNMPAAKLDKLTRSRLYERVAAIILKRIIKGEIRRCDKLPTERTWPSPST
jgi:DNA-binding FadR family transcriptional regulator